MISPVLSESSISFHVLIAMTSLGDFSAAESNPSTIVPSTSIGTSPSSSLSRNNSSRACLLDSRGTPHSASGEVARAEAMALICCAPTYLRTVNNQLSAVLNHAARYYGLHLNPAVCAMKMGGKERSEMQFWTEEEYLKFADEMMEKPREFLMFEIPYWTGIREGEMLAFMPLAFDLSRGTMHIDKSYQRFDGRDVITDPKTPKSIRTIKPSKFLVEEIADYLKRHPEIGPNDRMFPVTKYQISRAMKNGCQKSGVKKIRVHDLRHSHVSLLIDKGFIALAIVERMGHEAADITFRYAHLFPTVQEDMANALDDERGGF